MNKIFPIIFLLLLLFSGCSQKNNSINDTDRVKSSIQDLSISSVETESDTVLVKITDQISFRWNIKESSIIKDSNYYQYLKNKNTIRAIADHINSTTDLNIQVCSKKSSRLKVGDVAFLYLLENRKFYLFKCLKLQFDIIDEHCKIPKDLLDYIESNRQEVQKKIMDCIY